MNRKRVILILLAVVALALIVAPAAFAGAGGGSAGFSGGGGEGGGGGGGGSGFALFILFDLLFHIALLGHGLGALFLIALGLLYLFVTKVVPHMQLAYATRAGSRSGWPAPDLQPRAPRRAGRRRGRR